MTQPPQKGNRKTMLAWAFYDWANSVYPLIISTAIFPIFYEKVTHTENEWGVVLSDEVTFWGIALKNTVLYSYVVAASFVAVILLSPLLSGIADYSGSKKRFLQFFCYLGALSTASLYFFDARYLEWSMCSLLMAGIGFWGSLVFYNAYLPEVAAPEDHDRLSAKGFSLGYLGSVSLLVVCLVGIASELLSARQCFVVVGLWWMGFAHITYYKLPRGSSSNKSRRGWLKNGYKALKEVSAFIRTTKRLKRYLLAFFLLSMGVQTVMLMAVLFAKKEVFNQPESNEEGLIFAVVLIQIVAIGGAYLISFLSRKLGNIKVLGIALVIWICCCVYAYLGVYDALNFYILAGIVGLVMGGTQSLSRSTYSKFIPPTANSASFFSFYDIVEKLGIVIGMVIFGYFESSSGNMRTSILALITFFAMGLLALLSVPKEEDASAPKTGESDK